MTRMICAIAAAAALFAFGNVAQAASRGSAHGRATPHVNHAAPHVNHNVGNHNVNHGYRPNPGYRPYYPNYNPGYRPYYPNYNPGYRPYYPTYRPPVGWVYRNVWLIPNCRPVWHPTYQVWYYIDPYTGAVYYWYTYQY